MPYQDTHFLFQLSNERGNPGERPYWIPKNPLPPNTCIRSIDPALLANELTSYESELYFRISRRDCELSLKDGPTGSVAEVTHLQRSLARWVLRSVLDIDTPDGRACAIDIWLNTAWHCCRLGNYSSPYAILRGLDTPWLDILSMTAGHMKRNDCLEDLQERLDSSNNYAKIRALIANPRKLAWCVPPLEAYFHDFDKPIMVSHYLRKQSFSDAPVTDNMPDASENPNQLRPRYAFKNNDPMKRYMMDKLKEAETVSDEWLNTRSREYREDELEMAIDLYGHL